MPAQSVSAPYYSPSSSSKINHNFQLVSSSPIHHFNTAAPTPAAAMRPSHRETLEDLIGLSPNSATTTTPAATAEPVKLSTSSATAEDTSSVPTAAAAGSSSANHRAPRSNDPRWEVVRRAITENPTLGLGDLRFIYRLGSGDIGSVYLVEIKGGGGGGGCNFAAKVMDKKELAARNKEARAKVEKEILEMLDHPFLPTLYATLECPRWSCLLSEFCPGGDLHVLRQRQPMRRFTESTVRFYVSEVVVALEYLHMMGIIYRDLKPENVLIRSDGHIMLTDFDLSLKSDNPTLTPQLVSNYATLPSPSDESTAGGAAKSDTSCILPNCIVPSVPNCFHPKRHHRRQPGHRRRATMQIVAEPVDIRSMSFVGTHEYLAPEIVSGEGHGSAVDWWTVGVFMFEMFYGATPFKGIDNELTLANIVARALEFPKEPSVPGSAKELIGRLLVKDPARRMGSTMGAAAVKQQPFFDGVNWALLRGAKPPYIPRPVHYKDLVQSESSTDNSVEYY